MTLFTIGFTQKSARHFFELIKEHHIEILLDIRLNNKSQLSAFARGDDLKYFLAELCHCEYRHCLEYAPTKEILDNYKKKQITWENYEKHYRELMHQRAHYLNFLNEFSHYTNICLLCSESTPEHCHRRLISEMIIDNASNEINVKHI